jgi:hypothetical protein
MLFTKTQRIVASIALGAAVGAFIGEIVSTLSLLAGFASGGVIGGLIGFVAFHHRAIRRRGPEIWKQTWRNASKVREEHISQFAKDFSAFLFVLGQWIAVGVFLILVLAEVEEPTALTSIFAFSAILLSVLVSWLETEATYRRGEDPQERFSVKFLKYGNVVILPYYVIYGIGWLLVTVIAAVGRFLFRLTKAVYSNESLLVIAWAAFGAIAGIWLATTPITAAFTGAIAGAIFGGSQVYFICIPLGLISPATNNH